MRSRGWRAVRSRATAQRLSEGYRVEVARKSESRLHSNRNRQDAQVPLCRHNGSMVHHLQIGPASRCRLLVWRRQQCPNCRSVQSSSGSESFRTTVFAVCGALLALVLTLMSLLDAPTWARIVGAVLVLGLALASEADKHRTARREKERTEQAALEAADEKERKWLREARSALRIWPAPEIADADPERLGITPSRQILRSTDGSTLTRYVPRDIESKAAERLRSRGAVLLVGEPASGVTRTAYELALADPTRRKVLAPRPTDGLRIAVNELEALSRLAPPTRLLFWLDNIADHSTDGLNRSLLEQCKEESPRLRVIATIRSTDFQAWSARQPELATFFARAGPAPTPPKAQGTEGRRAVIPRHRLQPGHRRRVHRNRGRT